MHQYQKKEATFLGVSRAVYTLGTGPHVVILPEIPGLHPATFELGTHLVQAGFSVHLLSLFGKDGAPFRYRDSARALARACISKEFAVFARHRSSPITQWVRAYCRSLHSHTQKGIGLIGMCLTGNFALAMLAEPWMLAPVLSQPSLPFPPARGLHVDSHILDTAQKRPELSILGLRFTHDFMCPALRFSQLRQRFKSRFQSIEIDSSLGNPHRIPPYAHSVLSKDFIDREGHPTREALDKTISFLHEQLS